MGEEASGQLFGKYELLEKIGAGGMAEIYRARAHGVEGFEKILCVKRILPVYAKNRAFIEMLIAEAKLSSLLQHGNVVQIFDLGSQETQFYIVMEFVDGCDLLQLLTACAKRKEQFPTELALFIVGEVAKGLAGTRAFVSELFASVQAGAKAGKDLKAVYRETYDRLKPGYGQWVIFDHCLPFDVTRAYDEATQYADPRIWTAERDQQMWQSLEG